MAESIHPVTDLCLSSSDSSFVFGPVENAEWHRIQPTAGRIVCPHDPKLATELTATMSRPDPTVHLTLDHAGRLYHGVARLRSIEPTIELEIIDGLVPA